VSGHAIACHDLGKVYKIYSGSFARMAETLSLGRRRYHTQVKALEGVSFTVESGRALGVIGENGAGKSTLLKILAGTTLPSWGRFEIQGTVASLLELGTGFHADFTGRNNIYLAASVQGFSTEQIDAKVDEIIDFAELGRFIDQPVRTYSSGMVMRLGFAVATAIDPDVLIIDEILAVGDMYFQKKCIDRIFEFRERGKSILFCSHSMYDVRQICDEVIWIKDSRVHMRGLPQDVTLAYANYERSLSSEPETVVDHMNKAQGDGLPQIDRFEVRLADGSPLTDTVDSGVDLALELDFTIPKAGHEVNVGVGIYRTDNVMAASFNTGRSGVRLTVEPGRHRYSMTIPDLPLLEGEFSIVGYLFDETEMHMYDHRVFERNLIVALGDHSPGMVRMTHSCRVDALASERGARESREGPTLR